MIGNREHGGEHGPNHKSNENKASGAHYLQPQHPARRHRSRGSVYPAQPRAHAARTQDADRCDVAATLQLSRPYNISEIVAFFGENDLQTVAIQNTTVYSADIPFHSVDSH